MSLITDLKEVPGKLSAASKYTIANGIVYFATGILFVAWPGVFQSLFLDSDFAGHEAALCRVIGLTLAVIGWLYIFGGRSGGRQFVAATVVDRVLFVPIVLVPLSLAGVFPHVFTVFAILDPSLALGAWLILVRTPRPSV
ncbi:MAG: hypothetical protein A3I66_03385 [Burkholderiales bacterium RIFCSPLOWO2_02_FULL_57_36]|nr:MAG: hypothetical protein A3I66_03385 [Burkholderiales bacterium RIFCSPLOWO2_02_FULL_57_36]